MEKCNGCSVRPRCTIVEGILEELDGLTADIKRATNNAFNSICDVEIAIAELHKEYELKTGKFCRELRHEYDKEHSTIV